MWDDIKNIKSGKKELREFALVIGIALFIFGSIALWRGKATYPYLYSLGAIFIILGFLLPKVLIPLQKLWMAFSIFIGFFMSRVVLSILFYGIMTPIGQAMKLFGKDLLDERIDRSKSSYWIKRTAEENKTKESYEKQY